LSVRASFVMRSGRSLTSRTVFGGYQRPK
jgi:hypothetical protein